jgi:putative peptidoglycan lipid II flippase
VSDGPAGPGGSAASPAAPSRGGALLRAGVVTAAGTALSRVTGLVRVAAQIWALGYTELADTYGLANNLPNIVFELVLGGVFSATLVPLFIRARDDRRALTALTSVAMTALAGLAAVVAIAAPLLVRAITWAADGPAVDDQRAVATLLLRLFALQVVGYGFTSLATAALHARRRFAAAAFAPVCNNLVVTAMFLLAPRLGDVDLRPDDRVSGALLALVRADDVQAWVLGLGTTAGVLVMAAVLVPGARRAGLRLGRPDWHHPAVRQLLRLSGWTLGYVAANQLALTIVLALANGQDEGSVAAYQYAFVFFQLPHGLLAVSVMTVFTPELSTLALDRRMARFRDRYATGLRVLALVVLPAAIGYVVLGRSLVGALIGLLGVSDGSRTGAVLANFAIGLFPFSAYLFTMRAFYAMQDTRTPCWINGIENALNVVLAVALVGPLGVEGLALAFGLAYAGAAVVAFVVLARRIGGVAWDATVPPLLRIAGACAVMGVAVAVVANQVGGDRGGAGVVRTVVGVAVGVVVYVGALRVLRVGEVDQLVAIVRARGGRRQPAGVGAVGGAPRATGASPLP